MCTPSWALDSYIGSFSIFLSWKMVGAPVMEHGRRFSVPNKGPISLRPTFTRRLMMDELSSTFISMNEQQVKHVTSIAHVASNLSIRLFRGPMRPHATFVYLRQRQRDRRRWKCFDFKDSLSYERMRKGTFLFHHHHDGAGGSLDTLRKPDGVKTGQVMDAFCLKISKVARGATKKKE